MDAKDVKINGISRPDLKKLDDAIKVMATEVWATHPNNQARKLPFTPGPWANYTPSGAPEDQTILTGKTTGWGPDHLAYVVTPKESPEHAANLALIEAAPEVYVAAAAFVDWFKEFDGAEVFAECLDRSGPLKDLLAALAKARGEK